MKSIYDEIKYLSIENDYIINSSFKRFKIYEIQEGLNCYFEDINMEPVVSFIDREFRDLKGATIELFVTASFREPIIEKFKKSNDALKKLRAEFLDVQGIKNIKKYIVISLDKISFFGKIPSTDIRTDLIENLFNIMGISCRELKTEELSEFLYTVINLDENYRYSEKMTDKEKILQGQFNFTPNYLKIDNKYVKVLSIKDLPKEVDYFDIDKIIDEFNFPFIYSSSFTIGNQAVTQWLISLMRNLSYEDRSKSDRPDDLEASAKHSQATDFKKLVIEKGHLICSSTQHIIVYSDNLKETEYNANMVSTAFRKTGHYYYSEEYFHDKEFFKATPAATEFSERKNNVLTYNGLSLLPLSQIYKGDISEEFPLMMKNEFNTVFAYDVFCSGSNRMPWNAMVLGSSRSGKSVWINLLIMHSIYPRIQKYGGKCIILDYAGIEDSSYRKAVKLYGGEFIPLDSKSNVSINLLPPKNRLYIDGKINDDEFVTIGIGYDIILGNKGDDPRSNLRRYIIQDAIKFMYQELENPILEDILLYLDRVDTDDIEIKNEIKKLIQGFLGSGESRIVNNRTNIDYAKSSFVVFDLLGTTNMTPKMRDLLTFVCWHEINRVIMYEKGFKYCLVDEAAQQIKDKTVASRVERIYSIAAKYKAAIITITQNYLSFKENGYLAEKIILNTSSVFFLSHKMATEGTRNIIAKDFEMTKEVYEKFTNLKSVPRKYSDCLVRTMNKGDIVYSLIKVLLNKVEYNLATSDKGDNERIELLAKHKNISLVKAAFLDAVQGE